MRSGFSGGGWESCLGQSSFPCSASLFFPLMLSCLLCPSSRASWSFSLFSSSPSTSCFHLFCCYLTRPDFVFLSFLAFPLLIFWREGQKEDEGLKVCEGKFLEDVSGLCSQGTSCSQCEHGMLSMRSISMTIIFILQQSGSRQHSTTGEKKVLLPIRYTLCNILAVNTNKAMREKIMTRYHPSFLSSKFPF